MMSSCTTCNVFVSNVLCLLFRDCLSEAQPQTVAGPGDRWAPVGRVGRRTGRGQRRPGHTRPTCVRLLHSPPPAPPKHGGHARTQAVHGRRCALPPSTPVSVAMSLLSPDVRLADPETAPLLQNVSHPDGGPEPEDEEPTFLDRLAAVVQEPLSPLTKVLLIATLIFLILSSIFIGLFAGAQHKLNTGSGGGKTTVVVTATATTTAQVTTTAVTTTTISIPAPAPTGPPVEVCTYVSNASCSTIYQTTRPNLSLSVSLPRASTLLHPCFPPWTSRKTLARTSTTSPVSTFRPCITLCSSRASRWRMAQGEPYPLRQGEVWQLRHARYPEQTSAAADPVGGLVCSFRHDLVAHGGPLRRDTPQEGSRAIPVLHGRRQLG